MKAFSASSFFAAFFACLLLTAGTAVAVSVFSYRLCGSIGTAGVILTVIVPIILAVCICAILICLRRVQTRPKPFR